MMSSTTDPLTEFIAVCAQKTEEVRVALKPAYDLMSQLASVFEYGIQLANPKSVGPEHPECRQAVKELFVLSYVSYLSSARLATSGLVPNTHDLSRTCLESAAYAHYLSTDIKIYEKWANRHTDKEARQKSKFRWDAVLKTLEGNMPHGEQMVRQLYEHTIDFGAHPNVGAVGPYRQETATSFNTEIIPTDRSTLLYGMLVAADGGLSAVNIMRTTFPDIQTDEFRARLGEVVRTRVTFQQDLAVAGSLGENSPST